MSFPKWTASEEKLLSELYPKTNWDNMTMQFQKSKSAIKTRATILGFKRAIGFGGRKIWTDQDDILFRSLYPHFSTEFLVNRFQASSKSIYTHGQKLRLQKSNEYMAKLKVMFSDTLRKHGVNSRFVPGQVSFNKGRKQSEYMTPAAIERTSATRFKKGQDPHNTVSIGHVRISKDGYQEVKVRHDKGNVCSNFEFLHRIVYEQHHGSIPNGMNVEFLNGDRMDVSIENLVLRSREDNMVNNFFSDAGIVKRFMGVKEPQRVAEIIAEIPAVIDLKRRSIMLNQQVNKYAAGQTK